MPRSSARVFLALLCASLPAIAFSHSPREAAAEMTTSANRWLDALSAEQRQLAEFPLNTPERLNWHYIPKAREGLPLAKMNETQRKLARALLASGLSEHGQRQADAVMALEQVLHAMEGAAHRDETLYYFTVFGRPAADANWGWRVEGHHLSVNFTITNGSVISATPNFVGANPAEVRIPHEQQGRRALAAEEDLGRALVLSLSEIQRSRAIIAPNAPGDILTRNDAQAKAPEPTGLGYAALTPDQRLRFRELVALYAHRLRPEVADEELKKIADAGWNQLSFAWAGSITPNEGHYYRIQSPDFVIEFDNTQNHANHIHTVWRDFRGDFGRDLLREHYSESHK